jgi:4-amino-4-deoxychorismate lyase
VSAESALRDGDAAGFDLIETLRWEPDAGFVRLERHLARLYNSAAALGFSCKPDDVGQALGKAVANARFPQRVRLVLARDGTAEATAQPFTPLAADKVWRLRFARTRLDSSDALLAYKTTRRKVYVRARAEYLATQADEVLLMNERGEACEGTITNLFVDFGDGVLATPRLDCGLLPGVLREELLEQGRAVEAVIPYNALKSAKAIFVGNSLRGLIPAKLA